MKIEMTDATGAVLNITIESGRGRGRIRGSEFAIDNLLVAVPGLKDGLVDPETIEVPRAQIGDTVRHLVLLDR